MRRGIRQGAVCLGLLLLCSLGLACSSAGEGADGGIDAGPDGGSSDAGPDGGAPDAGPDGGGTIDGGGDGGGGGLAFRGTVLFSETFEDADLSGRGWYDGPSGTLTTAEAAPGSTQAFACLFVQGTRTCEGGTPGRHQFPASESVYLSYWVKYSSNWEGSGRPYHPHEFHFITDQNSRWVGPAFTRLTTYIEQVGGVPRLALQDGENVDAACVLRNDDSFVGCNGDFQTYPFTENRSVCSCNGLAGDVDERDCFSIGGGQWYSARGWAAPVQAFSNDPGPYFENDWHFIEAYFEMNEVVAGVGQPDGRIRYWFDGELLISSDAVLMRTGQHPTMAFDQFLVAPYIGDGSPVDQIMWIDDLTVATGLK